MTWTNASELDRFLVAENALNDALRRGLSQDEALEEARRAIADKRREQFLRSIGEAP